MPYLTSKIAILAILVFIYIQCQNCDLTFRPQNHLQSGSVEFVADNEASFYPDLQTYIIPLSNFQVTTAGYEITASTSLISDLNARNGFWYSVIGNKQALGDRLSLTLLQGFKNQWSIIKATYLISSNADIILGRRKFIFPVSISPFSSDVPLYIWLFGSRAKKEIQYKVAVFLSGLKIVTQNQFSIAITHNQLSKDNSRIKVNLNVKGLTEIEELLLYYIIYPTTSSNFYFGTEIGTYDFWGSRMFSTSIIGNSKFTICKKMDELSCNQNEHFENEACLCNEGFIRVRNFCRKECGEKQFVDKENQCTCIENYYKIEGVCQKCQDHSVFDGSSCVCKDGYFLSENVTCEKCSENCGTCYGSLANQCIACPNQEYIFENGSCICPIRKYSQNKICQNCTDNCLQCTNYFICLECDTNYHLKQDFIGIKAIYCEPDCGDGILQDSEQCDDGNNLNNDNCSQICLNTVNNLTIQHQLKFKGIARLSNITRMQFSFSKIPECFNLCSNCTQFFDVRILEDYQWINYQIYYNQMLNVFVIELTYTEIKADAYTLGIKLNPEGFEQYKQCLMEADFAQQLIYKVNILQFRFEEKLQENNIST